MDASARLRVALVGTGAMGSNHARILASLPQVEFVGLYDECPQVARDVAERYAVSSLGGLEEVVERAEAVVLAVPTSAHAEIGCRLLQSGLHLLVEKPMAASLEEADALLAAAGDRVLGVGHVEFFNPAVQALLAESEKTRFLEAQRLSPFTPRSLDVDVILDLMIHDLQILHALDGGSDLVEVRATGIEVLSPRIDITNARIELASGLVANITASRVSAEATRKLRVFQHHRYLSLDYRQQEINAYSLQQRGDERLIVPHDFAVVQREPLRGELESFVAACRGDSASYVTGEEGRRALATAFAVREAIQR